MSRLVFDESLVEAGTWFAHEDNWKVCLRLCSMERMKEIRKATTKKRIDFKKVDGTPARFEYDDVDDDKASLMLWDYCITNWEGIVDSKGNDLPCTAENKFALMHKLRVFQSFVTDGIAKLNAAEEERQEALEKN